MTTGERPFDYKTSFELLQAAVTETPEPPSTIAPDIPPSLEAVILRAMSKDPAERFQSARELRRTIEAIVRNPSIDLPNTRAAARPRRPSGPRPRPAEVAKTQDRPHLARAVLVAVSVLVLAYLGMRALTQTDDAEAAPHAPASAAVVAEPSPEPEEPPAAERTPLPETGGSRNGFMLRETKRLDAEPAALAFSRDGNLLAAGLTDGRIRTWNPNTGGRGPALTGAKNGIAAVSVAAASDRVAAVDAAGAAFVWRTSAAGKPQALPSETPARLLRFSESGQRLAVVADDGSVRVWDLDSNQSWSFPGAKHTPKALAFSPTGPLMAVSGKGKIALWGVGLSDKREDIRAAGAEAEAIAFSTNGLEMAAGVGASVITWDMPTRRRTRTYSLSGAVRALAYDAEDGWIAVTADAKAQQLWAWDVSGGRRITSIRLPEPAVAVALSSRGDRLAAATAAGEVHYWDTLAASNR
jgi:WD40 repeat protein